MDKMCMLIDLDGFHINGEFYPRELGCISLVKDHKPDSYHFSMKKMYIAKKNRSQVNYVIRHVHGLPLVATAEENAETVGWLPMIVMELYEKNKCWDAEVVGYKGGNIERDLLSSLGIPSYNIERLGCPKYDCLIKLEGYSKIFDCGHHTAGGNTEKIFHCPQNEVYVFKQWLLSNV